MAAATSDRDTQQVSGDSRVFPLAAGVKAWAGTFACLESSGWYLNKGASNATLKCVGIFAQSYDTTGKAAGAELAEVKRGIFGPFANEPTDLLTTADIGNACYMVDDQTVAKTNGSGARSIAGTVHQVIPAGVWIRFA